MAVAQFACFIFNLVTRLKGLLLQEHREVLTSYVRSCVHAGHSGFRRSICRSLKCNRIAISALIPLHTLAVSISDSHHPAARDAKGIGPLSISSFTNLHWQCLFHVIIREG